MSNLAALTAQREGLLKNQVMVSKKFLRPSRIRDGIL